MNTWVLVVAVSGGWLASSVVLGLVLGPWFRRQCERTTRPLSMIEDENVTPIAPERDPAHRVPISDVERSPQ